MIKEGRQAMKKKIVNYNGTSQYLIMIPVFYEFEEDPAWRKVFKGSKKECEKEFSSFPDTLKATPEENNQNRKNQLATAIFYESIGRKAAAKKIRERYHF